MKGSNVERESNTNAGLAEKAKRRRYGRPVDQRRIKLSPFVAESHTDLGKAAQAVVEKLKLANGTVEKGTQLSAP